jgi:hemerythrin-like domain-containing protein
MIVEVMMNEHKNILIMLSIIRKAMNEFMENDILNKEEILEMADFVKNYADYIHHGKEEKILFKEMETHIGETARKLVQHGMLVEHDQGRFYMQELRKFINLYENGEKDKKIDIIANAIGYASLLDRHIFKENNVIYTLAKREINEEVFNSMDIECKSFDENNSKQIEFELEKLEKYKSKYNII